MSPLWPDLAGRCGDLEQMDRPDCDPVRLERTVQQYARINAVLTSSRRLIRRHLFPAMARDPAREYTWLDLGAGGCDLPLWVARWARRSGWRVRIVALDHDPRILRLARLATARYPEITVCEGTVQSAASLGEFDFVFANHLLHHLADAAIDELVRRINRQVRLGFLLNDLRRSRLSYLVYAGLASVFLRNSLALEDGLLSIRRGFVANEMESLVAGTLPPVQVFTAFPGRIGLVRVPALGAIAKTLPNHLQNPR